jgi:hypothetical protein
MLLGIPLAIPRNGAGNPRNAGLVPGYVLAPGKGTIVPGNRLMVPENSSTNRPFLGPPERSMTYLRKWPLLQCSKLVAGFPAGSWQSHIVIHSPFSE